MYIFIINPISGKHSISNTKRDIRRIMNKHNKRFKIIETTQDGSHEKDILHYKDHKTAIFVPVGGDGTVSTVINLLKDRKPTIGIVPSGSANSLARELNIPLTIPEACEVIATSKKTRNLGALCVDDKRFILDVDVGINALVMQDTPRSSKRTWGWLAYMKHAIHWIFSFNSAKFHVTIDGKEIYTRATDVMIANGGIVKYLLKRIAGYNPSPKPHFEVIFTKIRGKRDYLRYLLSFILGSLNKDPGIDVYRVDKEVTIRCQRPLPVQGDGDIIGKVPVTVTILKNAVTVIVPNT